MRKCLVCEKPVYPQNEVDIQVGIIQSNEVPICQECAMSENEFVQMDVADAIKRWALLPF
jgi:Zn-finger protein